MNTNNLDKLRRRLDERMAEIAAGPSMMRLLSPGFADVRLYAIYLLETYHYTKHNARNQALVPVSRDNIDPRYAKFCLKHAQEETGHELMALHDLKALGVNFEGEAPALPPLPETQVLIAYIYWISGNGNPLARLGYSYWAERSYEYIRPVLNLISSGLGVSPKAMTFFNEHSEIDVAHAREVDDAILRFARTEEDWQAIEEVMITTLNLTTRMAEAVIEQFERIKAGDFSRYSFLAPMAAAG